MTTRPAVWFDHFVVAINDLDKGIVSFESLTGISPVLGGEHAALGTHNALVSLGEGRYLEILAPRPGASLHPMVQGAVECETLTPLLWALATDDLAGLWKVVTSAGYRANEVSPGSRSTREGETLRWSMFTMDDEGLAHAPFFIEWGATTRHPSSSTPAGCSVRAFTITSPGQENVQRLLTAIGFDASVMSGPARIQISLESPRGAVVLGS